MTDKIESKGKTVQEAVNEALLQMGARKDEVRVEVLEEPKSGLFGILGSKQARVLVTRKPPKGSRGGRDHRSHNTDGVAHDLSGGDGNRRRGGERGRRGRPARSNDTRPGRSQEKPAETSRRPAPGPSSPDQETRDRDGARESSREGRSGGRSRRGGRNRRPRSDSPSDQPNQARDTKPREAQSRQPERNEGRPEGRSENRIENKNEGRSRPRREGRNRRGEDRSARVERQTEGGAQGRGRGRNQRNSRNQEPRVQPAEASPAVEQKMTPDEVILTGIKATKFATPLRGVAEADFDATLADLTNGMLVRAGFPIRCEVKPGEYRQVRIVTDDTSAGMLIGRHGATVDSVEHLVDRMIGMAAGERVRMNLDINNYRRRREETLFDRVAEAADMVLQNGRTYHMEPMNARERRVVHLQVEPMEGVRTFTMGGGAGKHVVLAPDNGEKGEKPNADSEGADVSTVEAETQESEVVTENNFDDFDDGPQPLTNDLVVDDDIDHRPLI